jgi:two-component system heavy metal sensor histidine kinase CusS
MKLHFRFKIAMISFAVSGALLTAFGVAFFAFIYSSGLDRMDREIRSMVDSSLRGGHPDRYWEDFGSSLKVMYGEGGIERIALWVADPKDRILFSSENAPKELATLPLPELPFNPLPEAPSPSDHFMKRLDINQDGKVTINEFDGPPHRFSFSDLNKDGSIDQDEAGKMETPPQRRLGGRAPLLESRRDHTKPPTISRFQSLKTASGNWRVGSFRNREVTIIAAMDMDWFQADIHQFRTAFMIAVPLGLLLLGITGWFLASRAMKPIAMMADTAEGITAQGLDRRIPGVGNDIELERLVTVSNRMLDRLEKSYHQAVRFSADAAHELQTPLTILQGELDNAIQTSEDGSEEQQRYSMLLEELCNLKAVVQKLLLLAHADEGRLGLNCEPTDLSDLIHNAVEDIEIMAPTLKIETYIPMGIQLSADTALLNMVIRNMTSNAAKYAKDQGKVSFTLTEDAQGICFTLANTGAPIPEIDRSLIFDRFHRVDKARSTSGSGLGLSLAREVARAHGGDLVLNPHENGCVSFSLLLPKKSKHSE